MIFLRSVMVRLQLSEVVLFDRSEVDCQVGSTEAVDVSTTRPCRAGFLFPYGSLRVPIDGFAKRRLGKNKDRR
jgi:hypothetical protein